MDLIVIIFVVIGAVHLGWNLREIYAKYVLKKMNEELSDDLEEIQNHFKENVVGMKLEKNGEVIYIYDMTTNSFICQGKTKQELSDAFNLARPNKKGIILEGSEFWREANDK